jgi:hypothetical protein
MQAAMPDVAWHILGWALTAVAAGPIILAVGMEIWAGAIRPRLIPSLEIERLANEVLTKYPDDPEQAAFREEEYYWFRCDSFEQWKWRRVRREIQRQLSQRRCHPSGH